MRAIFLDRDGVICQNRSDHVKSWTEFEFLPGAKSGLAALSRLNLPIIVVTNQAVVGRGIVSARVVEEINRKMVEEITASGGRIDRVSTVHTGRKIIVTAANRNQGCCCKRRQKWDLI